MHWISSTDPPFNQFCQGENETEKALTQIPEDRAKYFRKFARYKFSIFLPMELLEGLGTQPLAVPTEAARCPRGTLPSLDWSLNSGGAAAASFRLLPPAPPRSSNPPAVIACRSDHRLCGVGACRAGTGRHARIDGGGRRYRSWPGHPRGRHWRAAAASAGAESEAKKGRRSGGCPECEPTHPPRSHPCPPGCPPQLSPPPYDLSISDATAWLSC